MQIKLTDHREPYGTSSPLSSNQKVAMRPEASQARDYEPTRGDAEVGDTTLGVGAKGKKPTRDAHALACAVHGEMLYISAATINRMLYGPDFTSPARNTEFDYRMRE
ncbi:hypothetical protein HAX54_036006 [Datura stramonium]|uniref:Uncharacterized protein n=1 Tax=Datura stramonium TaxID=4076 RepID=A0ABS8SFP4_DATST|nr:hypothetical protein [Datura stramonium]